jgi:hypothetical protein
MDLPTHMIMCLHLAHQQLLLLLCKIGQIKLTSPNQLLLA